MATTGNVPRHVRMRRKVPLWVKILGSVVVLGIVGVVAFAGYWAWRLQSNIHEAPLSAGHGTADATNDATDPLQILIIGTDTRAGADSNYGTTADSSGYGNSDVMILLNISADNKVVSMTSFPRDLMVPIPACHDPQTGKDYPAQPVGQINSAMMEAGPGCAVDTVNQLTGLQIDHFMVADFNAVKDLSNEIGGVQVCVNAPIDDPYSGLKLPAGTSTVQGEMALAFLRSRHGVGDGSDLSRIKSQQEFLASLARKVKSDGTLTNVPKLLSIADTITQNLTVDSGLANPQAMITIASRLRSVDLSKVAFVTAPWEPYSGDPNRVQLKQPDAAALFEALRQNRDLTAPATNTAASASASPSAAPTTPAAPAYDKTIQPVTVANGTGVTGRAAELATFLKGQGFAQSTDFNAAPTDTTNVYYSSNFADVAKDVAAALGIPSSQVQPANNINGVQVYVGSDFTSGTHYTPKLPDNVVSQTAAQATCQTAFGQ
ncbi:LCP family protein [Sinomonas terrae]|uniref:LCP family protein n=1 Tax=Sinomonas terrae TaxID=2908838 RepID=A0ABS9U1M3_9MICC|nr:LCP family protein [Sinomonas terrae]MCH6470322.1 LCP family protein [Sinomonas terrae]